MAAQQATGSRIKFREILDNPETIIMPGGFGAVYARIAEQAGFESFFVAGSQVSAHLYGVPDVGIIGLRDMVDHVRHVQSSVSIPVLVDADTAYGNAVNAYYTTSEFIRSGVAGMQIEDQEAPKKSGTSAGRRCISIEEAIGKYRAADRARQELDKNFVITARCDAIGAEGWSIDEVYERCERYVTEGNADMVWINSVQSLEQLATVCERTPAPVMTIWGGGKPAPSIEEYKQTGVKIVLYPVLAATAGMQAAWHLLNDLKERGAPAIEEWSDSVMSNKWGKVELRNLVGGSRVREIEELMLPADKQRDYESTFGHADVSFEHGRDYEG